MIAMQDYHIAEDYRGFKERGWDVAPWGREQIAVTPPEKVRGRFGLTDRPVKMVGSLAEAVAFMNGIEQAFFWVEVNDRNEKRTPRDAIAKAV
jgi:hypothetical protein